MLVFLLNRWTNSICFIYCSIWFSIIFKLWSLCIVSFLLSRYIFSFEDFILSYFISCIIYRCWIFPSILVVMWSTNCYYFTFMARGKENTRLRGRRSGGHIAHSYSNTKDQVMLILQHLQMLVFQVLRKQ